MEAHSEISESSRVLSLFFVLFLTIPSGRISLIESLHLSRRIILMDGECFCIFAGKQNALLWNRNQVTIVDRIRTQWHLDEFSEEEIHTICGILEVNCFEVGGSTEGYSAARALFDVAYLLCHECVPCTNHTDDPATHSLIIRSTRVIKKGEIISLSYAYTLQVSLHHVVFSCYNVTMTQ